MRNDFNDYQNSLNLYSFLLSSCQLDLSTLAKEHTHHLDLPLEESRGCVVLLVTLTASAHVSIADLSVTPLDDPQERGEMLKRFVSMSPALRKMLYCMQKSCIQNLTQVKLLYVSVTYEMYFKLKYFLCSKMFPVSILLL